MHYRAPDIFDDIEDGIIADPSEDLDVRAMMIESELRPQSPGIIQLQMDDIEHYQVFIFPDQYREFTNPEAVQAFIRAIVRDDELTERFLNYAANFKLINLDLNSRRLSIVKGYGKVRA